MKNKYLTEEGIQKKHDKNQKIINGISYFIGSSGPLAAIGSYILGSNMSGEAYAGLALGTPAVAGVFNDFASKVNQKRKLKALDDLTEVPLEVTNPEMVARA